MSVNCVPAFDVSQDLFTQVLLRGEIAVPQAPTMQDREKDLNLIHPRGVQRGVHKSEFAPVPLVEIGPSLIGSVMMDGDCPVHCGK